MIFILEGINGVGKTTLARDLFGRFGAPCVRPFRPHTDNFHWGGGSDLEKELENLDVPFNTYVDDLYVADMLSQMRVTTAVVDRSMHSACVYDGINTSEALEFWEKQITKLNELNAPAGGVLLVYLRANEHSVKLSDEEHGRQLQYDEFFKTHEACPRLCVDVWMEKRIPDSKRTFQAVLRSQLVAG